MSEQKKMLSEPVLSNLSPDFGTPPEEQNHLLQRLGEPHLDSFNYMLDEGLGVAIKDLVPINVVLASNDKVLLWIDDIQIHQPSVPLGTQGCKSYKIFPTECRQRGATYRGRLTIKLGWSINGKEQEPLQKELGEIPIMVKSQACHLHKMKPGQLVGKSEHEQEWGGYFIVKGHERLIRMLLMTRRNYPIAIKRSGWKGRGTLFSDIGLLIRCCRDDNTATNNTLHYVTDGTAKLMFTHRKILYYVPIVMMLKCLIDVSDKYIYDALIAGCEDDLYYKGCISNMLRAIHDENLHSHNQCKRHIGKMFRVKMYELPADAADSEICDFIIQKCVAIHLDDPKDKFNLLVFMTKKLFRLANDKCAIEGADAVMMQECLLGGHLYLQVVKEKLQLWLATLRMAILKRAKIVGNNFHLSPHEMLKAMTYSGNIESQMENFLSTGNIKSPTGLGLMQSSGLTIVAENINRMRYMSHFRAIHRGSFFQEMRTTEARQLLPDAWGFICPVHTPDGTPCGLLNHLTMNCVITKHPKAELKKAIPIVLLELGMTPLSIAVNYNEAYTVVVDGNVIGLIDDDIVSMVVDKLRLMKIKGEKVPNTMEIVLVRKNDDVVAQYPGLFIFTGPTRMMRPVINLAVNQIELIGTFEQAYLEVCHKPSERNEITTHQELSKQAFLSNLACLIPMPDFNQSPRNMYQCQMGKQTMGTPCHTWNLQAGTKLYRLQTPTTPLFRPVHHDNINLDDFAMGTNAIVAVISYTGYDMEDAMIINKSAYERGFAHGMIYKSEFVDLADAKSYFMRQPDNPELENNLDPDGLPHPGCRLQTNDPYYSMYDAAQGKYIIGKWKGEEDVIVDNVRLCGTFNNRQPKRACISFRLQRNPQAGDKFASRAGQKGICSQKWATEDLPFTESGIIPDIVFNPHGFPSRMTIAMMIEVMAGKSGAMHGLVHDASPFRYNEDDTPAHYFGKLLEMSGYNYYGVEKMYCGINGEEINCEIFIGVVHYQRLRHMVSDKWQVRSTGPMDVRTRQPLKGRKRGGGIRFGEMERDSLIAHGCAYLLQDRLFHGSDKSSAMVCRTCGTLLGPVLEIVRSSSAVENIRRCRLCNEKENIGTIDLPYIYKFLVTQLSSCNINVKMTCNDI